MGRAPNGLELSGPAKTSSYCRAAVAGSAPASCWEAALLLGGMWI